jgi:hypothetical protein
MRIKESEEKAKLLKTQEIRKLSKIGRPILHGGFSTRSPRELVRGRERQRLRKYLSDFREGLVTDLGGEDQITAARLVLVDRATMKLGLIRLIEIYLANAGPWDRPGEIKPVIPGPYMRLTDGLRSDLLALGLDRQEAEKVLTLAELAEVIETEGKEKEKVDEAGPD